MMMTTMMMMIGDRTFGIVAADTWNNVPPTVISTPSFPVFEKLFKICLMRKLQPYHVLVTFCLQQ